MIPFGVHRVVDGVSTDSEADEFSLASQPTRKCSWRIAHWNVSHLSSFLKNFLSFTYFPYFSPFLLTMDPFIKKEAFKLETMTSHAMARCFDACVDYRNPKLKATAADYLAHAQEAIQSLNIMKERPVGDARNDLTAEEAGCLERCSVKYLQTQRIVLHGIARRNSPMKEAAADLLKM